MKLIYISNDSMGLFDGERARVIPSQRVDQYAQALRKLEEQHAWKTEGASAQFMHKTNPYANAAEYRKGRVTGVIPCGEGILYAVDLIETGGVYRKNPYAPDEAEGLIHSAVHFHVCDLWRAEGWVYAALDCPANEQHIMRIDPATGNYQILTEGDTRERHPFLCSDGRTLHFDMCGIARDEAGGILGISASAIASLDLVTGDISEKYADPNIDYLKYTQAQDGTRRMMVRPHKTRAARRNPLEVLLAPFSAIAGFIHVFSAINAARKGKKPPLQSADSEVAKPQDDRTVIDGMIVDVQRAISDNQRRGETYPGIIPYDWLLVAVDEQGRQSTLQHGVLDYTPLEDGGYLYSNGAHVIRVHADGTSEMLFKAQMVRSIEVLA